MLSSDHKRKGRHGGRPDLSVNFLFISNSLAVQDSDSSYVYDESTYSVETEKAMDKMHMLFMKAFDKSSPSGEREKARREYMKIGKGLIRGMHERVMALDVKKGAALSHTDVLLAVHMMSMMLDMMATIQQEEGNAYRGTH